MVVSMSVRKESLMSIANSATSLMELVKRFAYTTTKSRRFGSSGSFVKLRKLRKLSVRFNDTTRCSVRQLRFNHP